jgi:protein-tyrosine phosphatase
MYGIGCRLSSKTTIKRILGLKQRDDNSGLIVLVPDIRWFDDNSVEIPARLRAFLEQYWPGNLTMVFTCSDLRFTHVAVNGKVAFRVPADDLLRATIELLDEPMISTSVNVTSLPAENDYKRLTGLYARWFDLEVLPNPKTLRDEARSSTVVEYIAAGEPGNTTGRDDIKCLREGSIPFYGIKKSFTAPTVMFVCTANICRSPIAEKLFNHYAHQQGMNIAADSSGLMDGGSPISLNSMQLLLEKGIMEAQFHVSKSITQEMVRDSWLIITMEERQRDFLIGKEPNSKHKIMTLNEIVGEEGDVKDPYGSQLDNYRNTYEIIEDRILRLISMINERKISPNRGNIA